MRRLVFFDLDGLLPEVAAFAVGHGDRGAHKGELIHVGRGGASTEVVARWTAAFLPRLLHSGLHPDAPAAIEQHHRDGGHLVLMTASADLYVPEIARRFGFTETVCSGVHWQSGALDGRLATTNRRGEDKARSPKSPRDI